MDNRLKKLSHLPDAPGIYLFYSTKKELVYVGKATSLRNRVKSYWRGQSMSGPPGRRPLGWRPIETFIHEVSDIKFKETNSVLEAVILEAFHIKKFQPKYNVLGKDDKSWNYIVVTDDIYPRVETLREHELHSKNQKIKKSKNQFAKVFGPYPGLNAKEAMKILREIFRFSTCQNQKSKKAKNQESKRPARNASRSDAGRPCLYYQMGQCLGVCTGEITPAEYKKQVIRPLSLFLSGKTVAVVRYFEKLMKAESKAERFEEAARIRNQLRQLKRIQDIALVNRSFVEGPVIASVAKQSHGFMKGIATPRYGGSRNDIRIEGYDISNLGANEKVGSMVVFDNHGPVKSEYRKFIIKTVVGQSDVDCLKEVLSRRFRHDGWALPNVVLIDGGRPQVNAVKSIVETHSCASLRRTPILGIVKGPERKRNDIILGAKTPEFVDWVSKNINLLIQVRDEAHRFAISFHRQRRAKRALI